MPFISRERVEQLEAERARLESRIDELHQEARRRESEISDALEQAVRLVPALNDYVLRGQGARVGGFMYSIVMYTRLNAKKIANEVRDLETFEAYKRGKERSERLKPVQRGGFVLGFDPAASEGTLDGLVRTFNTGDLLAPSRRPSWGEYMARLEGECGVTPKKDQSHPNPNGCGAPCALCDNPQPASETTKHPVRTITVDVVADMKKLTEALADAVARQSETKDTEGANEKGQDVKGNPKKKKATK
ncbi:hypothetical protein [Timonella senegalensis]|uniref:hypothetical protein n=1 Tax=Timonella senegalensis TaxID=1465825 RepID=UPI0002F8F5AB|nr:hypothetical protein [Timonella senegalensis]